MGIPRLRHCLEPYGKHKVLGKTDGWRLHSLAIIDGPGLAYAIYRQLVESYPDGVSYRDCALATTEWLANIASLGFDIKAIFFDGALPSSKRAARMARLEKHVRHVRHYRFPKGCYALHGLHAANRVIYPPPFLVFSVVEELLNSIFAAVTYVVPGEADPFCVAAADDLSKAPDALNITIFSDDSDLLVYATNACTRVVTFRDLYMDEDDGIGFLKGIEFRTFQIARAKALPVPNLIRPAFFMQEGHTFEQAVDMARRTEVDESDAFVAFAATFRTADESAIWKQLGSDSPERKLLTRLDSRVSELVCQVSHMQTEAPQGQFEMFLPFHLEDPDRASAWSFGRQVRQLAYSLLLRNYKRTGAVMEYMRRGERVGSLTCKTLRDNELSESIAEYAKSECSSITEDVQYDEYDQVDSWRLYIMRHVLRHLSASGDYIPTEERLISVVTGLPASVDWFTLHVLAQYQATYYSFRMLAQVLAILDESVFVDRIGLSELRRNLETLPPIASFFSTVELNPQSNETTMDWTQKLREIFEEIGHGPTEEQGAGAEAAEEPNASSNKSVQTSATLANNPFALLSD